MSEPELTLVIVSYNVCELLMRCLASLERAGADLALQVIVVDNASADDSVAQVRERFSRVELIASSENLGFARANNLGLERARGRYRMLLNPDTEIPARLPNPLSELVRFMDKHPRAGACGPSLVYGDGKPQHSAFHFPTLAQIYIDLFPVNWRVRESRLNGRYPAAWYERGAPFRVDHPLGAALLVRPEAVKQIGLLDTTFFIYAEEIDWCMRLKRAGWEVWCVPSARIIHHEAQSTRQFRERMFVELWRARLHLFGKHYSTAFNSAARLLVRRGMARAERIAQAQAARGELGAQEEQNRLRAYQQVSALTRSG